jgi:DNA-binding SARP family transcriptional activator
VQPSPLLADREFVILDGEAVTVDVAEFEQLIDEGTMEALTRAAALYRGDLLDGLDLRDAAFDEWLLMEKQRLRDLAREALAKLIVWHMSGGAHDQAAAVARRLLAIDPLREAAHRSLMQIYSEARPDGAGTEAVSAMLRCASKRTWCQTGGRNRAAVPVDPGKADDFSANSEPVSSVTGCRPKPPTARRNSTSTRLGGRALDLETFDRRPALHQSQR